MAKLKKEYLYGVSPCYAALLAGRRTIYKVFLCEKLKDEPPERASLSGILRCCEVNSVQIKYKSRSLLDRLAGNRPHQNVVIHARSLDYTPFDNKDLPPSTHVPLWIALDQVQDPMNFGAILRSAAYFGVDKVLATEANCCSLTPAVSKASAGAMEWLHVYNVTRMSGFLQRQVAAGWDVIGTVAPAATVADKRGERIPDAMQASVVPCHRLKILKPTVLVLGNEGFGLSDEVARLCTQMTTISPFQDTLPAGFDSLNVSVATGILLYSLLQNRRTSPSAAG